MLFSTRGCCFESIKHDNGEPYAPYITQDPLKVTDPGSSFCAVQKKLLLPSEECCLQTHGQSTGGHVAETDSSSLPWTRLTSPAGLEKVLLKYCRSDLLSNTLPQSDKPSLKILRAKNTLFHLSRKTELENVKCYSNHQY